MGEAILWFVFLFLCIMFQEGLQVVYKVVYKLAGGKRD